MGEFPCLPPDVLAALTEIVAQGVVSGLIDRHIPIRHGFIDAASPGEPARIAAHLAASPAAPEWAAVHEPLASLLRETIRLAAGPPSLSAYSSGAHHRFDGGLRYVELWVLPAGH